MIRTTRKSLLTVREKVLLHLLAFQRYNLDADAPKGVTQEGIANATGVGRNNVTKIVTDLAAEGMVEIETKHVKGLPSVRKVYSLRHNGFQEALRLKNNIESTVIDITDMEGKRVQNEIGKLSLYLPKRYTFLELALGISRGEFDCQSFHEGRIKEERRFVDYTDKKPTVRSFHGREVDLRKLSDFLDSDNAKIIVVQGMAGIGKTTLLAKFAQDVRDRANIFWFKVHDWVNLKGFLRPLGEFLSQLGKKGLEWYLTQNEMPNIGEVCHILENELKDATAIWIFDDVQKSEKSVIALLSALVGVLENLPKVKMICTSREIPSFYPRGALVRGTIQEMVLEGLDKQSSYLLMRERSIPDNAMEQIFNVTKGHPLFMELVEEPQQALGKNIRIFIEQEVYSKLDLSEKRILEMASVFRYPVPTDSFFMMEEEISRVQGQGIKTRAYEDFMVDYDTIDVLTRKALLKESAGRMVGMHDIIRDFFYSRLAPRQRILYHKAASRYYLQDPATPSYIEALYHSMMANDCGTSVRIAAGNGREIIFKGYANLLEPLLGDLLSKCSQIDQLDQMEILFLQAEIQDIQGEWDLAINRYAQLISMASPERDRPLIADINRRIGVIHLRLFQYDESNLYLRKSKEIAESINDLHTLVQVYYDIGGVKERTGDCQEALECFQRSKSLAQTIGEDIGYGKALYGLGRVHSQMRDLDRAIEFKREALEMMERTGDRNEMAKICSSLGIDLVNQGMREEACNLLERAVELANTIGDLNTLGYAQFNLTACYIEIGELEKAELTLDQASQISQRLNEKFMLAAAHLYRGYLYHKRGEWEWAKESFQSSLLILRTANAPLRLSYWLFEIGKVYLENAEFKDAKVLLDEALQIAKRMGQDNLRRQVEEAQRGIKN